MKTNLIYHLFSIYLRTLKHLDHCSHSSAKKRENVGTFPMSGTPLPPVWEPYVCEREKLWCIMYFRNIFGLHKNVVKVGMDDQVAPLALKIVINVFVWNCENWLILRFVIFGWYRDIWLKLWYLANIVKFCLNFEILAGVVICDIWLTLWYLADILIFGWYCDICFYCDIWLIL